MDPERIQYLKFDPVQPKSYSWVSLMYDATPFEREADAKGVKSKVPEASGVVVGEDHYYYVMKVLSTDELGVRVGRTKAATK